MAEDHQVLVARLQRELAAAKDREAKLEAELSESGRRYRSLFESRNVMISIFDRSGRCLEANEEAAARFGKTTEELIGSSLGELHPSTEADRYMEKLQELFATGEPLESEDRVSFGDRDRWLLTSAQPLRDQTGAVVAVHLLSQDITKRKGAEQALRESEERFRKLFHAIPDAVTLARAKDGVCVDVNAGVTAHLGFQREELLGQTVEELAKVWKDCTKRRSMVETLTREGRVVNYEAEFLRKDGNTLIGLLSALIVTIGGEPHLMTITRDITVRRRAEEARAKLERQLFLAQKMEAIGTLAGGVAHEFNNILAGIMGFTELALTDLKRGGEVRGELEQVLRSADRAKDLVQQILTFGRRSSTDLYPLDLSDEVRRVSAMLGSLLPKMVDIRLSFTEERLLIYGNGGKLEQILVNLATNAVDAMSGEGQLELETGVTLLDEEQCEDHLNAMPGRHAFIKVSDTGEGMDSETIAKIYDPFFTTKEVGQGTGLGLSTVFGLVQAQGGHIRCRSELGRGTTFTLFFPAISGLTRSAPTPLPTPLQGRGLSGAEEQILLVDDEGMLREIGARMLAHIGYRVLTASSGEEALALFDEQGDQIDLVILDLSMPGMGGRRCLQALRERDPAVLVLITSGYSSSTQARDLDELGVQGFISKPFRRIELLNQVARALDRD